MRQPAHVPKVVVSDDVVEPQESSAGAGETRAVRTEAPDQPALDKMGAKISPAHASATPSPLDLNTTTSTLAPGTEFRFHHPQPFVGRLATTDSKMSLPKSSGPSKGGRGRPKRKRDQSRPDIRRLPDFEGDDPIEEE
ncbi:hypothetical protein N3K66_005066 [Trichothecium roseum]|uniref:Uncharacterized protein n=1 Tax=Trichothecium roseum TaxID=47278 RepID=A0ACC0V2X6_9HYPO|nr:hypothetical protein N3K66_005066 [Trichothecium roseum]